jgi:AmmeMemoRadiSam system protein A
MLTSDERLHLLAIARAALEARVRGRPEPDLDSRAAIGPHHGAFVTISCRGELRGCLGRLTPELPLTALVRHLAQVVADSDPRFDAVRAGELDEISIEISVLTPAREIASVDEIEIGRHGLIAEQGARSGLLLPQVAVEHGWSLDEFVRHTCLKAGLAADAWRRGATLFAFEAQVFGEDDE